eukprot:SAG31_NODE_5487_length_2511_cov_6.334577_1_plen_24_part_10
MMRHAPAGGRAGRGSAKRRKEARG